MTQEKSVVKIREIQASDVQLVANVFCFPWTTIQKSMEKWQKYYEEHTEGSRTVYIVEKDDLPIGYASLIIYSAYPDFLNARIPEISDLWIKQEERGKRLATQLIKRLESLAKEKGYTTVGLGVGLYVDYGSAQRLYYHLGYVPDGKGITYKNKPIIPGHEYPVDDDLILWLTKTL